MALRTTTGRCVVLCRNGIDVHDVLTSRTPFVAAAVTAWRPPREREDAGAPGGPDAGSLAA